MKAFVSIITLMVALPALSACQTVKIPDVDFLKIPEFREIVKNNQTNVPDIGEIPDEPIDVRSDKDWDSDATNLLDMRDAFMVPQSTVDVQPKQTQEQIDAEFARLKAQAQAYKIDDPQ